MGFRENLLKKVKIVQLAKKVEGSINPLDSGQRIDQDAMRQLLEMGSYAYQKERDLDLYFLDAHHILLLDNELKIYNTTAEDIALRKNPTVKEMISIRNAIKILNDKDVVVSRKRETVQRVQKELTDSLDLSFTAADIQSMVKDGIESLENKYADGVIEILILFAELLGYQKAPKPFRVAHHHVWGEIAKSEAGAQVFGPMVLFDLMHNSLKMCLKSIKRTDKEGLQHYHEMAQGDRDADLSNAAVIDALAKAVLDKS